MLNVVEAPDILNNETSSDTIVDEGASVHLRCKARGAPEPTISWRRQDKAAIVLRSENGTTRGGKIMLLLTRFDQLNINAIIMLMLSNMSIPYFFS